MRRAVLTAATAALVLAVGASMAYADGTPSRTRITFYFGLARPEASARSAFFAVQQPGNGRYRHFLTPAQVSGRYGAGAHARDVFVRGMRRLGLSASVDRSGVFGRVQGTVAQIERAFGVHVTVQVFDDPNSLVYSVQSGRLSLPAALRAVVREIIPLSIRSVQTGAGAHDARNAASRPGVRPPLRAPAPSASAPANNGTWIAGCNAARATGAYSFAQVRQAYGLGSVGLGAGGSVAFLTDAEGPALGDIAASERCFGFPRGRVHLVFTDGQTAPFLPDTFEPIEDLALVRGMAPGLRSVYVSEAWGAESLWFLAAAKLLTFAQLPDTLSISYGFCERSVLGRGSDRVTRDGIALLDSVLVRLGLAGVGTFASAGDSGSSCNGLPFRGLTWPGSSPYLTSVGGSRLVLNAANQRVNEVV